MKVQLRGVPRGVGYGVKAENVVFIEVSSVITTLGTLVASTSCRAHSRMGNIPIGRTPRFGDDTFSKE
jgi:hypothetical protein